LTTFRQLIESPNDGWQEHTVAALFVVAVVAGAWALTRLSRTFFRVLLARFARHAMRSTSGGQRRARINRKLDETRDLTQMRQRHRIDAVAIMLARLAGVVIWLSALVVVLHYFDVNIAFAVSSAGFVGLIVALGAQQSVQDYITGIHVLLEDRYSEGDDIEATTPSGQRVRGVVARLGAFSTQLEAGDVTWHLSNRTMIEIANHSQRGISSSFEVPIPEGASSADIASAARSVFYQDWPTSSIAVVDRVEVLPHENVNPRVARVHVRASRGIPTEEQAVLADQTRRRVED
jgi:small-conductance mechanosensitive channel